MIRRRIAAFVDAGRGVVTLMKTQVHAWVHLVATLGVFAGGLWFGVTAGQWCALVLSMGLVWSAEALNTAIEFVVDLVSPEHHDLAGKAKDAAAAAVLLASVAAAVVGVIVFGPHLTRLLTVES
ncbi:MAG: diacylglycerol kinase family protein [Planctomycetaceae bacterium]|nr:diacylglycerol kinase family protein [Planctomycetaceae bacterium]